MTESNPREIEAVLAHASRPVAPAGAIERLLAKLPEQGRAAGIVPFVPRRSPSPLPWPALAALAASFALGIYLGAAGADEVLWPEETVDTVSALGLGEAEAFLGGEGP